VIATTFVQRFQMKILFFILLLFIRPAVAQSQNVPVITVDQLESRVTNGSDTTYIINFWATWCVPCLKELPAFEKLNKNHKADKLKILLVNVDVPAQANHALPAFVKKAKLQSEVWLLNEKNGQAFIDRIDSSWSGAIPATLMVKGTKHRFFEKGFTYTELLTTYRNMQ
jgi:thiol-disulfide isomerase/thioredoxin